MSLFFSPLSEGFFLWLVSGEGCSWINAVIRPLPERASILSCRAVKILFEQWNFWCLCSNLNCWSRWVICLKMLCCLSNPLQCSIPIYSYSHSQLRVVRERALNLKRKEVEPFSMNQWINRRTTLSRDSHFDFPLPSSHVQDPSLPSNLTLRHQSTRYLKSLKPKTANRTVAEPPFPELYNWLLWFPLVSISRRDLMQLQKRSFCMPFY